MIIRKRVYKKKLNRLEEIFTSKKGSSEYNEAIKLEKEIKKYENFKFFNLKSFITKIIFKINNNDKRKKTVL